MLVMLFLVSAGVGVVTLLLHLLMHSIKDTTKYLKNIRGPKPIFPFGNMLDFFPGSSVFIDNLLEYLKIYGDTIVVHDGSFSWAIITVDYDFNDLMFNSSFFNEKADQYSFLHRWLGQGLLTSKGNQWRTHRKAITPSFHFSILQGFISVFDSVGDNLVRKLRNEAGKDSVEISKTVSLYALDVICEAAMGVKINALDQENSNYIKSIKTMCNIAVERTFSFLNPIVYPLTWNYQKEKRATKIIHEHVEEVISKRIEEHKLKKNTDWPDSNDECGVKKRLAFLDLLLESRIDGKPLSMIDIRDEVNTFMFEGHDTTSSALSFCMLMLATHAEVQEKVFNEQKDICGPDDLKNARPTYKQLNEMKHLDLVIKETLRLFPSVPFFGRRLAKDLEFKGTLYPKGINILIFPYAYHRNPEYFPEPEKFIPERFIDTTARLPFVYTPFSAGPRNCIGQKFAMLEMLSTISKIVRNFELGPAKPEHKIKLAAETILISKNGVKISLQNRT